jgi:hypothetical protein
MMSFSPILTYQGTTTYGIKHTAEHDIGYVTNRIFIAAAAAEGFNVVRCHDNKAVGRWEYQK